MNQKRNQAHRDWAWLLFVGAAGLLGVSLWLMAGADESVWRGYGVSTHLLRQGGYGLLALMLAWTVGRFSLHRPLLRHWYLFPALLLLVMLAAPVSEAMGSGRLIGGYGWWTRSVGVGVYLLALIFTASFVLPRFARGERGGNWTLAILIGLLVAIPLFFLKRWGIAVVGLTLFVFACAIVLPRRKLVCALIGLLVAGGSAVLVKFAIAPEAMQRLLNLSIENSENFQLRQALLSIHSGGLLGWGSQPVWIPEWHTDFMFAHLCGASGWFGGLAALAAIGMIFTAACRIAVRQEDLRLRAFAAACAAAFVLPAMLHVAVNLGWFPTLGIHFPFLSFAPNLLLLNGLLLGLLLSLSREPSVRSEENSSQAEAGQSRWPVVLVFILIWGLTGLFALRIGALVYAAPHLHDLRQDQSQGADDSQRHSIPLPRSRILDVNGRVLARIVLSLSSEASFIL